MKKVSRLLLVFPFITSSIAQEGGSGGFTVASRSAHETVWQRVEWKTNEVGRAVARTNEFVELATGLNWFDEASQQWQPSREEWEVYADAIVARYGQHKIILSHDLNLAGAVDVLLPDGVTRLISAPVSMGFYDPVDGKQVVIAEVMDCAAERGAAPNEIVFRNCFDRIRGSIRYLYTKAGVHQHVVLEQKLELPEGFSDKSRLECYTVFDAATPWPQITTRVLRREKDPLLRAQMVEPDFTDSDLSFGSAMAMRKGKAFSLGEEAEARSIRVGKQFLGIEGMPVLIEAVEFTQLEPLLAGLASTEGPKTEGLAINSTRQVKRAKEHAQLPREHFRAFEKENEIQLASNPLSQPAVVIDYELLTSGTATLTGGTTWYVSGLVNVTNLQIEGTAVVKLTNSASARINVTGTIDCRTGPYRPAVFTSLHDNSVGQTLPGSSGNPTNSFYGFSALVINEPGQHLHDLRVAYATSGITLGFSAGALNLDNVQFVRCAYPIDSAGEDENTIAVDNGLFYTSHYVIRGGEDLVVSGRHLTINRCGLVGYTGFGSTTGDLYLTNSLVVAATNGWGQFSGISGSVTTNHTAYFTTDPGGIFQTVGAASHYLADGTYRGIGTTNLDVALLASLRKKTTYPPVEITTNLPANTILSPQAARDADTPDLGFHYDPLDFVVNARTLSATLTLTNGVAVGTYGASGSYGISVNSGGKLVSIGSPTLLNRIVRYNTVQEQANTNWSSSTAGMSIRTYHATAQVQCRFTDWSLLGNAGYHLYVYSAAALSFRDCQFGGGSFYAYYNSGGGITNCLWDRVTSEAGGDNAPFYMYNNLVRGGRWTWTVYSEGWIVRDNTFDSCLLNEQEYPVINDHNAYIGISPLGSTGGSDKTLTNADYQIGRLGAYYYPTNGAQLSTLINAGSRNATGAGLYYFTTTTNQARENNTTVDIGFHYAADLDGDGIVDYDDADDDGDGMPDDWEIENGLNPELNDADDDPDGDWVTNVNEYNGGTDSTNPRDVMVVAWGDNSVGQCDVPLNLRGVRAVAAGDDFSLALRNDGTVVGWGVNDAGQTNVPATLTNALAVAANFRHAIAVRSNGTVSMWGMWWHYPDDYTLYQPSELTNVAVVAAGANHDLASGSNGVVTAWSTFGSTPYINVPTNVVNAKALAAGYSHSVAVLSNGSVSAWGENFPEYGWYVTNVPPELTNAIAVASGDYHTVALKSDGTVVAWGAGNEPGQILGYGQAIVPAGLSNVAAVAAGGYRSLALRTEGTIVGWGDNFFGQNTPPAGVSNLTAMTAALNHTVAVRSGRQLPIIVQHPSNQAAITGSNVTFSAKGLGLAGVKYQWQFNGTNIAGETNATLTLNNVQASNEGNYQVIISTGAGSFTSSAAEFELIRPPELVSQTQPDRQWVTTSPFLLLEVNVSGLFLNYQWKLNGTNLPGATQPYHAVAFFNSSEERQYSVTITNAAGTTNSTTWKVRAFPPGGVAAWGNNDDGQLNWPTSASNIIAIAAGGSHSLAASEDGSVIAWGLGDAGQINGPALTNAIAVAAGNKHSLALRDNGTVVAWGRNVEGQTNVPAGLTNVIAITACGNQSLALRKNGTVTNWGNTFGTIPSDLTNAIAIAAGTNFCLVLRSNGTVAAWGNNDYGQTTVPASATNLVAIAAGDFHALALKENGTVMAWGLNTSQQASVPGGLSNVMIIAAGWAHSAALKNDGTVVAWGDNTEEQTNVGDGLKGIKLLAAGGDHTLASAFDKYVQYQVDVSKDLLLVYNSTSTNSVWVKDYYLAHRPMVAGANVLGIGCTTNETFLPAEFTNNCAVPVLNWLVQNPTKHPQYIILFLDIPSRVNTNNTPGVYQSVLFAVRDSVSVQLYDSFPGIKPFVTHLNMGGTNECKAYIDKLRFIGTNYSPGKVVISASATGQYSNTNYVVDNVRHVAYAGSGSTVSAAASGLIAAGVATNAIAYTDQIEPCTQLVTNSEGNEICVNWDPRPHLTNGVSVAGYISWGTHSSLGATYPTNGLPGWTGDSSWWIIETAESFNGIRGDPGQGTFLKWFSANAFGGTNYSNTPVGAVTHVDEPQLPGANDAAEYFGLWATGKRFGTAAWISRNTPYFQAVGDPLVRQ